MHDDLDEIFGGLEDEDDLSSTDDVADGAMEALSALDIAEHENPDLAAQFFGDSPFEEMMDLPESEELQQLSAQYFGDTQLDEAPDVLPESEELQQLSEQFFGDTQLDEAPAEPVVGDGQSDADEEIEGDEQSDADDEIEGDEQSDADEEIEGDAQQDADDEIEGDAQSDADDEIEGDLGEWGEILRDTKESVVGENVVLSAAFREYVAKRAADTRAESHIQFTDKTPSRWRDWTIDFGPVWAPAGESLTVFESPQVPFRSEKIVATDTGSPAGQGTMITTIIVGQRLQRPAASFSLTAFFSQQALGNGITFDIARPEMSISIGVRFMQSCTFMMSIFGKAMLED